MQVWLGSLSDIWLLFELADLKVPRQLHTRNSIRDGCKLPSPFGLGISPYHFFGPVFELHSWHKMVLETEAEASNFAKAWMLYFIGESSHKPPVFKGKRTRSHCLTAKAAKIFVHQSWLAAHPLVTFFQRIKYYGPCPRLQTLISLQLQIKVMKKQIFSLKIWYIMWYYT